MAIVIDGTTGVTMPAGGVANTASAAVGTTDTQTLTNKTIQGGALTLATAQASTSGTFIDFTGIPSWVKRITVMFSGVSTAGANAAVLIQLGTNSGVENTGYVGSNGAFNNANVTSVVTYTTGFCPWNNGNAAVVTGNITFTLVSANLWVASGVCARSDTTMMCYMAGSKTTASTLDRVRITTTNGTDTFDAGSINIMYEG